ncbi:MAG: hypothetical protein H3C64_02720 [Candidatus Kuenenia stuttgartiensis]|nr:hypothetical protein [Candidatus Kuenenia stuttgartiensis]
MQDNLFSKHQEAKDDGFTATFCLLTSGQLLCNLLPGVLLDFNQVEIASIFSCTEMQACLYLLELPEHDKIKGTLIEDWICPAS